MEKLKHVLPLKDKKCLSGSTEGFVVVEVGVERVTLSMSLFSVSRLLANLK